jgi:type IX secretion system PorP/SprF family membrane protein
MKKLVIFILLLSFVSRGLAQDVHWSQYYDNPLYLNPALSGDFEGTSRFHLQYRDQWRSVTRPFQSISFTYDTKFDKYPGFGLGTSLLSDVSGDGTFKTFELNISPSYQKILSQDSTKSLRFGMLIGVNQRNFNFNQFFFDEQFNGINYDPNLPITESLNTDKKTNLNIGAGTAYIHKFSKKTAGKFSLSAFNLNQPNQGFYGEKVKRDIRFVFASFLNLELTENLTLLPSFQFQKQGTYKELIFGSRLKFELNSKNANTALFGGLFMRSADAALFNLALQYKNWYIGFNYDLNFSSLVPASNRKGGFELVAKYVINRFKPKRIQHRICPEYM